MASDLQEIAAHLFEHKDQVSSQFFVDHNNVLKKMDKGRKKLFEVRYVLNSIHSKVEVNQVFDENLVKDLDLALGVTTIIHKVIMKGVPRLHGHCSECSCINFERNHLQLDAGGVPLWKVGTQIVDRSMYYGKESMNIYTILSIKEYNNCTIVNEDC